MPSKRSNALNTLLKLAVIIVVTATTLALIEFGSYVLYTSTTDEQTQKAVEIAIDPSDLLKKSKFLPSTLWHHRLNPNLVNNNGTIGPDFQAVKPLNVYRIICLGDSTSEWPKHHPQFLQEKLIGKSHERKIIEVINAGIGGHVSAFTLQYFALRLVHFKPDLVILKVGYNDYLPFGHPELGYDYSVAFPKPFTLHAADRQFWSLARYSYFLKLAGSRLLDLPGRRLRANMWRKGEGDFMANADKMSLYLENIKSIIYMCKARGIGIIVLDLPTASMSVKGLPKQYKDFIKYMNARLKQAVISTGTTFIETKPYLTADDFADHCHLKPSGGEKIADLIISEFGVD